MKSVIFSAKVKCVMVNFVIVNFVLQDSALKNWNDIFLKVNPDFFGVFFLL